MKVGDWVRNNNNEIFQLEELHMWQKDLYSLVKLWRPAVGEWCWFDKNKLGKFWKKQGTRNYWTLSDFVSISEKTKIPSGDYFVSDYCEPFIGQLPSFIKDK